MIIMPFIDSEEDSLLKNREKNFHELYLNGNTGSFFVPYDDEFPILP